MAEARLDIKVVGSEKLKQTAKDFVNLSKEANLTKEKYSALGAAQLRMVEANKKLTTTLATLKKLYDEGKISLDSYRKAKYEAERQAREFIKTDKNLIAVERERKRSLEEAQKAQRRASEEADRARQKHDQLYAAEVRLTKATQELAMAVKGGGMAQERADAQLEMLTKDYHLWIQAVKSGNYAMINSGNQFARFNDQVFRAQQRVKRFASVGLQQAGYQVQDFIVQIQSGQSALVAFGQQGSQLAGIFGSWGIWIGAGIAAFTGLMMVLQAFDTEAKKLAETIKEQEELIKSLTQSLEDYDIALTAAALGTTPDLVRVSAAIKKNQELMEEARKEVEEYQKALDAVTLLSGPGDTFFSQLGMKLGGKDPSADLAAAKKRLEELKEVEVGLEVQLADLQQKRFEETHLANEQQEQLLTHMLLFGKESIEVENKRATIARQNYENELKAMVSKAEITQGQSDIFLEEYDLRRTLTEEVKAQEAALDRQKAIQDAIKASVDNTNYSKVTEAAKKLKEELKITLHAALGLMGVLGAARKDAPVLDPREQRYDPAVARVEYLREIMKSGDLYKDFPKTSTSRGGGGKSEAETLQDKINKLVEQIAKERELLGLTEAQQKIVQALGSDYKKAGADVLKSLEDQINQQLRLNERLKTTQEIFDTISSAASQGFMAMVEGTKTVKDAFRDMAREIIKKLYEILVVQQIVGSFNPQSGQSSGLVGLIGSALTGTPLLPAPAAAPAIGKMASTSKIAPVVVNQSFSFAANGDESVKRIIAQSAPQIAQMTQKQIMDSRRRGGQMKATFS